MYAGEDSPVNLPTRRADCQKNSPPFMVSGPWREKDGRFSEGRGMRHIALRDRHSYNVLQCRYKRLAGRDCKSEKEDPTKTGQKEG